MDGASGLNVTGTGPPQTGQHNGRVRAVELTPPQLELARWLLNQETRAPSDLPALAEAADRVLQKLLGRLARLITPIGCRALLSRALHLTRADYVVLQGLQIGQTNEAPLEGLSASVESAETGQARAALTALLGTLIGLVVVFIGEDLTMRLLLDLWTALPVPSHPVR